MAAHARSTSPRRRTTAGLAVALLAGVLSLVGLVSTGAPAAQAMGDTNAGFLSAGSTGTCAVTSTGAAKCWGSGSAGQLGNGASSSSSSPVQVSGLTSGVTAVSYGGNMACAVVNGAAKCWGTNAAGLGDGTTTTSNVPVQVSGLTSGVTAVAVGQNFACALQSGAVKCWGTGSSGQLGTGGNTPSSTPTAVSGLSSGVTSIAAAQLSMCAVQSGAAKCWGTNVFGQVGDIVNASVRSPFQVQTLTSGVTAVAIGSQSACAVQDGAAKCWGAAGLLGDGSNLQRTLPGQVTGLTSGVTAISVGFGHSCAVASGAVKCWGQNGNGQLGNGTTTTAPTPVTASGLTSGVKWVSAGISHTCATSTNGTLRCWGDNASGALGLNVDGGSAKAPLQVIGLTSGATAVATFSQNACAVVSGAAKCWGVDQSGSTGTGVSGGTVAAPTQVVGLTSGVTAVSLGSNSFACGLASGAVSCWGTGTQGQLGNGVNASSSTPVPVTGLDSGVTAISSGSSASCAIQAGAAKCWGVNSAGQLGVDTPSIANTPVQVQGLTADVTAIAIGSNSACAVVAGAVKCWGFNLNGQLGDGGAEISTSVPVQVAGLTSGATAVAVGQDFACAVVSGAVKCWGKGTSGQLGNSASASSTTPVQVTGLTAGVDAITASFDSACATSSGAVSCWGNNVSGSYGVGDVNPHNSPQPVISFGSGTTAFSTGYTNSCGIQDGGVRCAGTNSSMGTDLKVPNVVYGTWAATVNSAPSASNQNVSAPRRVGTQVILSASDSDNDPLEYTVVSTPTKGTLDCNGTFGEDCLYTAGPGQTGSDSFTFKANDGTVDSNTATVSITITNQAPTVDPIAASAPRGIATDITLTGADPNSDPFTFAKATEPSKGTATCTSGGACTYTANPGAVGTDSFTYTASDGDLTSAAGTVTITITNQAPSADDRLLDAGRGVATPVVLSGSDPNTDTLTYEIVSPPTKGTVVCDPVGSASCTYQSAPAETGTDSFSFRTNDGQLTSPPATVAITLVNAGPTANAQALEAPRNVDTPIVLSGADGEGDALTFAVVDAPTKGTLTCGGADGSTCSYKAGAGQGGTDSFTFTTDDGTETSAPATVTITITNQAPVANAQTVAANAPLTGTPITLTGSDPNGDDITFATTTSPTKGIVTCTGADGSSCTYTAAAGKTGTDSFKFTATDPDGASKQATISINLDANTPGVYVGQVDFVEPETGNGTFRSPFIPVMLTTPAPAPVTVWYHTVDGTAVTTGLGGDYREWGTPSSPRSLTIPAGQTTGYIQPPVFDDDEVEPTEHFDVVVTSLTGGASYLGGTGRTRVNIIDADTISTGTPILSVLDATQYEGNAGTRTFGFRVVLSKPATAPVKVTCTPVSGTAIAGVDFKAGAKTVTIGTGGLSAAVDILGYANANQQGIKTFTLSCAIVGTADVNVYRSEATATTAIATILDED